ncbi:MAG: FixH family protein [Flavobacteriales bacterium]|nr:FixH family protein [Flavobacteriales bacterium]
MKFNWGHGIFISMVIFVIMMTSFMVRAFHNQEELVTENYYAEELKYQDRIDRMTNATEAGEAMRTEVVAGALVLTFPARFAGAPINGSAHLLKPNDSRADRTVELVVDNTGRCTIDTQGWMKGVYHLQVDWNAEGVDHYSEDHIHVP